MARSLALVPVMLPVLLLLASAGAAAEEARLPKAILDDEDLSIHVLESSCNTYLVTCKKTGEFAMVDPGPGLEGTFAAWKRKGRTPKAIWVTHEHGDHTGGVAAIAERLQVPVVAHAEARARMKGLAQRSPGLRFEIVADGATLAVGATRWKTLHLPGHAAGSLGYLLEDRVLVAGDVLFKGSVGRTDLPGSDPEAFAVSLGKRLWPLPDRVLVLPGHGAHTTLGAEKRTNRLFQDLARKGRGEPPVPRPWMGVRFDAGHRGPGIRLAEVVEASPAAAAGLRAGDVLLTVDGVALGSPRDLLGVVDRHAVGDTVSLELARGADRIRASLTFRARPAD